MLIDRPIDQGCYFFAAIATIIACLILAQIQTIWLRKLFSLASGCLIGAFFHGVVFFMTLPFALIAYIFMVVLPRNFGHKATILMTGSVMVVSHKLYEPLLDAPEADRFSVNLLMMILFCK